MRESFYFVNFFYVLSPEIQRRRRSRLVSLNVTKVTKVDFLSGPWPPEEVTFCCPAKPLPPPRQLRPHRGRSFQCQKRWDQWAAALWALFIIYFLFQTSGAAGGNVPSKCRHIQTFPVNLSTFDWLCWNEPPLWSVETSWWTLLLGSEVRGSLLFGR